MHPGPTPGGSAGPQQCPYTWYTRRAPALCGVIGFRVNDVAVPTEAIGDEEHVGHTAMPPPLAQEPYVEVLHRCPGFAGDIAAFPSQDPLLDLLHHFGEPQTVGLVEQGAAICSGTPNPPGYESLFAKRLFTFPHFGAG